MQRSAVLALAAMTCLLPTDELSSRFPRVITQLCSLVAGIVPAKGSSDRVHGATAKPLINSVHIVLHSAQEARCPNSAQLFPQVMAAAFSVVCYPPDHADKDSLHAHHDSLRCFELVAASDAGAVLAFLLGVMDGVQSDKKARQRTQPIQAFDRSKATWGVLVVLRHIVTRFSDALHPRRADVVAAMAEVVYDNDLTVKSQLAQLIMAVAPLGWLACTGGQSLVHFIIQQCADPTCPLPAPPEAVKNTTMLMGFMSAGPPRGVGSSSGSASGANAPRWWRGDTTPASLQSSCENICFMLASACVRSADSDCVMWPAFLEHLMEFLLPTECVAPAPCLLQTSRYRACPLRVSHVYMRHVYAHTNTCRSSTVLICMSMLTPSAGDGVNPPTCRAEVIYIHQHLFPSFSLVHTHSTTHRHTHTHICALSVNNSLNTCVCTDTGPRCQHSAAPSLLSHANVQTPSVQTALNSSTSPHKRVSPNLRPSLRDCLCRCLRQIGEGTRGST